MTFGQDCVFKNNFKWITLGTRPLLGISSLFLHPLLADIYCEWTMFRFHQCLSIGHFTFPTLALLVASISLLLCFHSRPLPCELDMDGKRVRSVACGSTHTACLVTRAWVSDDLIKNCMACKTRFTLVNRKVL